MYWHNELFYFLQHLYWNNAKSFLWSISIIILSPPQLEETSLAEVEEVEEVEGGMALTLATTTDGPAPLTRGTTVVATAGPIVPAVIAHKAYIPGRETLLSRSPTLMRAHYLIRPLFS